MSEEVEENTCAEAAQVIEHLVQSIPCSSVDIPPPSFKAQTVADETVKKIIIDESDDENYSLNMGSTFADHNYDVPDPSKRYRPDPNESKKFEVIDGLTINDKNELVFTTSRTRDIISTTPTTAVVREVEDRRKSEPSFRFAQRKVDYSPGFPETSTPYSTNRNPSSGYYISDRRSGNFRTATVSKPRTLSTSGITPSTPGELYASQRKIEPPQRVHDFRINAIVPNRQTVGGHFNSADPSQAAVANAPAPLLVCGNRNVIHRNPIRAKRDESTEPLSISSPLLRSPLQSPRKQVHFLESSTTSQSPSRGGESRGPLILSTPGALQRKVPQSKPVPPHRQISISAPNSNVPMRSIPARPNVPSNDPHSLPDNIMEDSKHLKHELSPSRLQASEVAIKTEKTSDSPGNSTAEMIKEKIATVTREIEMEKMFEKPTFDTSASNGPESASYEAIRARGRPRVNWSNRTRNSLSNSSGTIGSSSPQSAYTNGSPTKSFNISYSNSKERPPVRSPTRANLDFNNHVAFGTVEGSKSRLSYPFSKKVTNKTEPIVPARGRGRRKREIVIQSKKSDTDVTAEEDEEEELEGEDEDEEEEGGKDWYARCVCTLEHGFGLTVCCDRCNCWQHGPCYGITSADNFPEKWVCENCKPRKLYITKEEALVIQEKLGHHHPIRRLRKEAREAREAREAKKQTSKSSKVSNNRKHHQVSPMNTFSRNAKQLLELTCDSGTISKEKLQSLEPSTKIMVVAPDIKGLVCKHAINAGELIIEFFGQVLLPNERTREGFQRFSLLYDGLNSKSPTGEEENNPYICIDANKSSGDARYARRSCRPNCSVRHILSNGHLNVFLVANENLLEETEITIPFDIDSSVNDMQVHCWCSQSSERDKCLFRQTETAYTLGHAIREDQKPDINNIDEDKKIDKRGRPKGKGRRSKTEVQPEEFEEKKIKEEVEQKDEKVDARPPSPAKVSVDRDQKPEVKKDDLNARPTRKIKDLEKSNVNYTLPADRNKPSREEMKIQQQLALMESAKSKKEAKQIEKRKSKSSAESPTRRRSRKDTEKEKEKEKEKIKEEEKDKIKEKKKEKEKEKEKEKVKEKEKEKVQPIPTEVKPEISPAKPEDAETPKYQPPRKRWLHNEKVLASSAPAAASDQKVKHGHDSRDTAVVPSKKQWLRRHAAQSEQSVTPSVSSSTSTSPSKKRRMGRGGEDNAEAATSGELRVQFRLSAEEVLKKLGDVTYVLPKHIEGVPSVKEKKEVVPEERTIKEEVRKEEDDSKSKIEEPPQKNPKRLSIEDYRKRRPRVPTGDIPAGRVERSFIPSMDNIADQTLLLPITLPDPTRSSLDALKKDIYGEMTGSNETLEQFGSLSPQAPHSTSYLSGSERVRSPQKSNIPRSQASPPPRPSIADRLAVEFGLEFSPKKQENEVPPVTQLPVCPPPVSRREQSSTNVQLNRASSRKSRW